MKVYQIVLERRRFNIPIRPSSDNLDTVLSSNFLHGHVFGHEMAPIHTLSGGIRQDDPRERARVQQLANTIASPGGYISRILVDPDGNVVEGQHRLEAMRLLGHSHMPITRIGEITTGMPAEAMMQAVANCGVRLHREQIGQVVANVAELAREVGPENVAKEFEFPRGWEAPFEAALNALLHPL